MGFIEWIKGGTYEMAKGPIPEGYTIDHLCYNPRCINPGHLEAVTMKENIRRRFSPEGIAIRVKIFSPRIVNSPNIRNRMFCGRNALGNG